MNRLNSKIIIGVLVIVFLVTSACSIDGLVGLNTVRGSGDLVTEDRSVSDFDRVSMSGSGDLVITQGDEESLTIETDDNIMPYITSEVKNGTLHLGYDIPEGKNISPTRLTYTLKVKDLTGVEVSGSGSVEAASIDTCCLDIVLNGSGNTQIDSLNTENLVVEVNGSADVELSGEAADQVIEISGSGKYKAGDLQSESVDIKIDGSSDVTVWATESLVANINGSGSVDYYGKPTTDISSSGSGKANSLGDK